MLDVTFDASDFEGKLDEMLKKIDRIEHRALGEMGDELLRLSSNEVPHDTGALQATGNMWTPLDERDAVLVGYHTPYAARLHEHPEYNFQKGRKGKYLEDPLKQNLTKWLRIYAEEMEATLK